MSNRDQKSDSLNAHCIFLRRSSYIGELQGLPKISTVISFKNS